jgi:hypothetical protein
MWLFFSKKIRTWLLLSVGLPLTRVAVHRLAVAADHHDESARTARALHKADTAITAVSRRTSRRKVRSWEAPPRQHSGKLK